MFHSSFWWSQFRSQVKSSKVSPAITTILPHLRGGSGEVVDRSVVSFRISFGLRESPERSRGPYAIIRATQTQVHEHRRRRNCDRTESEFIDIRMEWESLHKSLFRRTNRLTLVVCWWDTLCVVLAALLALPVPTTTIPMSVLLCICW